MKNAEIKAQRERMNQITTQTSQRQIMDSLDMDNLKLELKRIAEVKDREIDNHKFDIRSVVCNLNSRIRRNRLEIAFVEKRLWADREMSL